MKVIWVCVCVCVCAERERGPSHEFWVRFCSEPMTKIQHVVSVTAIIRVYESSLDEQAIQNLQCLVKDNNNTDNRTISTLVSKLSFTELVKYKFLFLLQKVNKHDGGCHFQ